MKRIISIIILAAMLAALSACGEVQPQESEAQPEAAESAAPAGTPAPAPSEAPEETPVASPEATPEPTPVPVKFDLPETEFEPDGWWIADAFGENGQALMLTGASEDGSLSFQCWYNYGSEIAVPLRYDIMNCGSFSALDNRGEAVALAGGGSVKVSISGDTLTVTGSGDCGVVPGTFYRTDRDGAIEAFRDMPYNDEAVLPFPRNMSLAELNAIEGMTKRDDGVYEYKGMELKPGAESFTNGVEFLSITARSKEAFPAVRGISVGSAADDVLACFPGEYESMDDISGRVTLYGTDRVESSRGIAYNDSEGCGLFVTDGNGVISFSFADGLVESIAWSWLP